MSFQFRRRPDSGNMSNNPKDPYFEQNQVYQDSSPQMSQHMPNYEHDPRYNNQPQAPNYNSQYSAPPYYNNPDHFLQNKPADPYNAQYNHQFFSNDATNFAQNFPQPNFAENPQQNLNPYMHPFQTNQINRDQLHNIPNYPQPGISTEKFIKSQGLQQKNIPISPTGFEDEETHQSSPIKLLVTVVGIVILAAISWFAYKWVKAPIYDGPVIIQADDTPHKVRPDHKGGVNIPYQDKLIYNRISDDTQPTERILPPDETYQPEDYSQEIPMDQENYNPNSQIQNPPPQYQNPNYLTQNQSPQYAQNNATYTQQQYENNQLKNSNADVREIPKSNPAPASEKIIEHEKIATPKSGFFVQLATVKSESAGVKEWNRLKNKFGLQKQNYQIKEFETAEGETVYRVLMGPFEDKVKALKHAVKIDGSKLIQIVE